MKSTKVKLLKSIRDEMTANNYVSTERVMDLFDLLIAQGGATLGDVTKMKKILEEKNV